MLLTHNRSLNSHSGYSIIDRFVQEPMEMQRGTAQHSTAGAPFDASTEATWLAGCGACPAAAVRLKRFALPSAADGTMRACTHILLPLGTPCPMAPLVHAQGSGWESGSRAQMRSTLEPSSL
jgi:hypothetical protein